MVGRVLVADDDAKQRQFLRTILEADNFEVVEATDAMTALELFQKKKTPQPDVALIDLHMPDLDGIELITRIRALGQTLPILMLTSDGSIARAVLAMRAGANDFLIKPTGPERLLVSIRNALELSALTCEVKRLSRGARDGLSFDELIAVSPRTQRVIAMARRAARSEIPVMISGESGTGKEIFARAIHGSSARAKGPFIAVNCGALPGTLVESILFGHEKGAFTGATERRAGKFQEASGGTLFLDELGELPLDAQVKLLRALETGEVDPVGARKPVQVDIRLLSATNRDLEKMVASGAFREDLFYRISVFPLEIPPLRERREDLPSLARMFLKRFSIGEKTDAKEFSQAAMDEIMRAQWPGNVRQLENTIHRAVILAEGSQVRPEDLLDITESPQEGTSGPNNPFIGEDGHMRRLMDIEAQAIRHAITHYNGRMSEIARRLGIGRSTLYRKLDELQINRPG